MVSPRKRERAKPKPRASCKTGGRGSVQVRENIPFDEMEVVKRTQVTGKMKNRVVVQSTNVKVPVLPSTIRNPSDPPPTDHNDPQTSDQQENLGTSGKPARKGPSRSTAV